MKSKLLIIGVFAIHFSLAAQTPTIVNQKNKADKEWKEFSIPPELPKGFNWYTSSKEAKIEVKETTENFARMYREKGLIFWRHFPNDSRRYDWLISTLSVFRPYYWSNVHDSSIAFVTNRDQNNQRISFIDFPIDLRSIKEWEVEFSKLRHEFLAANIGTNEFGKDYKKSLLFLELENYIRIRNNINIDNSLKLDLKVLKGLVGQASEAFYGPGYSNQDREGNVNVYNYGGGTIRKLVGIVLSNPAVFRTTNSELHRFVLSFKNDKILENRQWAAESAALLDLKNKFFEFRATSTTGDVYDLKELKGKVVFLDFWSTSCKACIAAMPKLKSIYDKYKNKGFEVLSISIDKEEDAPKVQNIQQRIGANWPVFIVGGNAKARSKSESLAQKLFNKYGFTTVPQLFLLDKNGKLICYNDSLRRGNYESVIRELLEERI